MVDKDRAAAILGRSLNADTLLILTNVDGVYTAWGTEQQQLTRSLSAAQAEQLVERGELGTGSMQPKVRAAIDFLEYGGRQSIIAHLDDGWDALQGTTGTSITRRGE